MTHIYPLKKKSSAAVLEKFREYKPEVEKQTGKGIRRLRTDGGWRVRKMDEDSSQRLRHHPRDYSPDQNGVAEHAN